MSIQSFPVVFFKVEDQTLTWRGREQWAPMGEISGIGVAIVGDARDPWKFLRIEGGDAAMQARIAAARVKGRFDGGEVLMDRALGAVRYGHRPVCWTAVWSPTGHGVTSSNVVSASTRREALRRLGHEARLDWYVQSREGWYRLTAKPCTEYYSAQPSLWIKRGCAYQAYDGLYTPDGEYFTAGPGLRGPDARAAMDAAMTEEV